MREFTRREILRTGVAGAGLALAAPVWSRPKRKLQAYDRVELGQTGIRVSRVAIGTGVKAGYGQSMLTKKGQKAYTEVIRHGLDRGLNFIDMAEWYGCHEFTRKALEGVPRDKYVLLTKLWTRPIEGFHPSGGAIPEVHRYLKELGTDHLEVCLIHYITYSDYIRRHERARDELLQLKEKGLVGAVGISCHHLGALRIAARDPWVDVIFARINYRGGFDYKMDGPSRVVAQVLKTARANGKAVVGMKIYAEGKFKKPEEKDASMSYVLRNELTDAMTIGVLSPLEIDDNIERVARVTAG